jgi:hypothetical protein
LGIKHNDPKIEEILDNRQKMKGMETWHIQKLPVREITQNMLDSIQEDTCALCLMPYEEGQEVRELAGCSHIFHLECIDQWLLKYSQCPDCG